MTSTRRSRKALLGLAAFASVAAILPLTNTAQAASPKPLPPGTPAAGVAVLTPGSGTNANNFSISLPADPAGGGAKCPGDGINGYRFGTYITPISNDPSQLTFDGSGSPIGPALTSSIRNPAGTFVRGLTPGAGDGLIALPAAGLSWVGLTPPAGAYNVGIACTLNDGDAVNPEVEMTKFWNTQITVASTGATTFSYSTGVVPSAPDLEANGTTPVAVTATTATVDFTQASALPPVTGFTATVTPSAGVTIAPLTAASTSISLSGLTTGTPYSVTLVATNATGPSAASNAVSFTPGETTPAPAVTVLDAFDGTPVTINWTAPASGPAPTSYDVAVTPGGPTFTTVTGLSQVVTGLATGGYTASVTPNYPAGSGFSGTAGTDSFNVTPNALIYQEITVTRPPGALVLTQRCGVYGPLDPFVAVDAFPGFPRALIAATTVAGTPGTPEAPDTDLGPGYTADPNFPNYPEVGTYPTECGLSMGTARFVTSGALAGQFYTADGRLNQVTVLDTRDVDAGWTARGDIEDSFGSGGDTFSGNYLGWAPQVTDTSDPSVGSTYDQVVNPGGVVLPGAGTPGNGTGLTSNPPLAFAAAGAGLGIATLDARMNLLIPASADAGDYSATLSLTVA